MLMTDLDAAHSYNVFLTGAFTQQGFLDRLPDCAVCLPPPSPFMTGRRLTRIPGAMSRGYLAYNDLLIQRPQLPSVPM
jgi:hypothetical protein